MPIKTMTIEPCPLEFAFSACSVPNDEHRGKNEDRWLALPESGTFAVSDGLGGHAEGDKASEFAKQTISRELPLLAGHKSLPKTVDAIERLLCDSDCALEEAARADRSDMGTTVALLWMRTGETGTTAIAANVGDSRIYHYRMDGTLHHLTTDHDCFTELLPDVSEREIKKIRRKLNAIETEDDLDRLSDDE